MNSPQSQQLKPSVFQVLARAQDSNDSIDEVSSNLISVFAEWLSNYSKFSWVDPQVAEAAASISDLLYYEAGSNESIDIED
jgi:hypothetical protein